MRGYRLRFNLDGHPRGRAAPANLPEDPRAEVWGVLYRITRRDLVRLDASEGVPWWRYRSLWLEAEDASGAVLRAVTYIAQGDQNDRRPLLRYLTLLRDGARAHGLPDDYVRFLEQIEQLAHPLPALADNGNSRASAKLSWSSPLMAGT